MYKDVCLLLLRCGSPSAWCKGMKPTNLKRVFFMLLVGALASGTGFGMSVTLDPSSPSPAPLSTVIGWTASVAEANSGVLWYRFSAHAMGEDVQVLKDFGTDNKLDWTVSDHEGLYEIKVSVRNITTGDVAEGSADFEMKSLVHAGVPIITRTSHPLVYVYSAVACAEGFRMRVQFTSPDGGQQNTPYQDCRSGLSMNFILAGLRAETEYSVRHTIDTGSEFQQGPVIKLMTSAADRDFVARTVLQSWPASVEDGILLQASTASNPLATDLNGNVVWYYRDPIDFNHEGPFMLTRPDSGGYLWGIIENVEGDQSQQFVREYDLTGRTVLETNAARIGEQLVAMGKRPIGAFHHEARRLKDGNIAVLGTVEQILTDVQGAGPVDILGDMIVVMDHNLQVVWAWDTFDHLDPARPPTLNDRCPFGGCPPLFLATAAHDWTHGNAISQTPDGSLLYSTRSQDWVIKIDYANGEGSGNVLWRVGKDGDFQFNSTDPYPWFSHQHDAHLLSDNSTLLLFDNGNIRKTTDAAANSRGQVIALDEKNRVANLTLNADLGHFSAAMGSAQLLPSGDYHFDLGVLEGSISISIEVNSSGQTVHALSIAAPEYRTFRMRDMYTPPHSL